MGAWLMSSKFRTVDRDTLYLLPSSVQDWLPDDHLARFVVEVVERLDRSALERQYSGGGWIRIIRHCCWVCCSTRVGNRSGKPVCASVFDTRDPADAAFLRVVRRDAGPNCSRRTGITERLPESGLRNCQIASFKPLVYGV